MTPERHDVPLLEYDGSRHAIIDPDHEKLAIRLPERAVFAFLGEAIDRYAARHGLPAAAQFESITKNYPVYILKDDIGELCLMQAPLGAPAAVQIMDWLIAYGVKKILSAGSCGVLVDMPENALLIPIKALRDEGTSHHYLPASRFAETDPDLRAAFCRALDRRGISHLECTSWTTDGFYRETREKLRRRREEGCSVVEMECAALAACAKFRGAQFAQLLYTADSLAGDKGHDMRGWGRESIDPVLDLCLAAAAELK